MNNDWLELEFGEIYFGKRKVRATSALSRVTVLYEGSEVRKESPGNSPSINNDINILPKKKSFFFFFGSTGLCLLQLFMVSSSHFVRETYKYLWINLSTDDSVERSTLINIIISSNTFQHLLSLSSNTYRTQSNYLDNS